MENDIVVSVHMYVCILVHRQDGFHALRERQGELGELDVVRSYLLNDHLSLSSEYVAVEGKPLKIPAKNSTHTICM